MPEPPPSPPEPSAAGTLAPAATLVQPEKAEPPLPATQGVAAGAAFRGTSGPAPRFLVGATVFATWELARPSIWSPAVRLSVTHQIRNGWVTADGTADFALDAVGLDLCPLRLGVARVGLRLCASALGGRLAAQGSHTFNPRAPTRPFATAGGAALLTVVVHRRVELSASIEPAAALIRDRFSFDPDVLYQVPRATISIGAGLAMRFP